VVAGDAVDAGRSVDVEAGRGQGLLGPGERRLHPGHQADPIGDVVRGVAADEQEVAARQDRGAGRARRHQLDTQRGGDPLGRLVRPSLTRGHDLSGVRRRAAGGQAQVGLQQTGGREHRGVAVADVGHVVEPQRAAGRLGDRRRRCR
jgi:hypothetical protein